MTTLKFLLAFLALAATAAPAAAQDTVERFLGYAYELDSGRYAFTEVVEVRSRAGRWIDGRTSYIAPDGRELARKSLDWGKDPFVPIYRLDQGTALSEGITEVGERIAMERREGGRTKTAFAVRQGLVAADAGLPRLLRAHFDALLAGQTLPLRVVAPLQLDSYRFKARRIADVEFEGKPAIRIEVDLGSLLTMFAEPLEFAFDPATQRLLEFRGITNLINPATGDPYSVRISYFTARPRDAPALPRDEPAAPD